jgi:hypothetical protein
MKSTFYQLLNTKILILLILVFGLSSQLETFAQNFEWAKSIGNSVNNDAGKSIAVDAAGNVYTTGYFNGLADFDPSSNNYDLTGNENDIFITKFDINGNFIWAKRIGGPLLDVGNAIVIDSLANIYITGNFEGTVDFDPGNDIYELTSNGNTDIFILKLDSGGNFIWAKSIGGLEIESSNSIHIDHTGNILIAGKFNGMVDFDPGAAVFNLQTSTNAAFFLKLDNNADMVWAKKVGATTGNLITEAYGISTDTAGNVYSTGYYSGNVDFDPGPAQVNLNSNLIRIFILKLDVNGIYKWVKTIGGISSDEGKAIITDKNANVYITGYTYGVVDLDPGVAVYNTGTLSSTLNIFILKLTANGEFVWGNIVENGKGMALTLDSISNVYITGWYQGATDFDPSVDNYNLTALGSGYDIFLWKLDSTGTFQWAKSMGAFESVEIGNAIAIGQNASVYSTGEFQQTGDFDPGMGTFNLVISGNPTIKDIFIHKLSQSTITSNKTILENENDIIIFPNPANDWLRIESAMHNINKCTIFDMFGQQLYSDSIINKSEILKIDLLPQGIYFLELSYENGFTNSTINRKFIKQ